MQTNIGEQHTLRQADFDEMLLEDTQAIANQRADFENMLMEEARAIAATDVTKQTQVNESSKVPLEGAQELIEWLGTLKLPRRTILRAIAVILGVVVLPDFDWNKLSRESWEHRRREFMERVLNIEGASGFIRPPSEVVYETESYEEFRQSPFYKYLLEQSAEAQKAYLNKLMTPEELEANTHMSTFSYNEVVGENGPEVKMYEMRTNGFEDEPNPTTIFMVVGHSAEIKDGSGFHHMIYSAERLRKAGVISAVRIVIVDAATAANAVHGIEEGDISHGALVYSSRALNGWLDNLVVPEFLKIIKSDEEAGKTNRINFMGYSAGATTISDIAIKMISALIEKHGEDNIDDVLRYMFKIFRIFRGSRPFLTNDGGDVTEILNRDRMVDQDEELRELEMFIKRVKDIIGEYENVWSVVEGLKSAMKTFGGAKNYESKTVRGEQMRHDDSFMNASQMESILIQAAGKGELRQFLGDNVEQQPEEAAA